MLCFNRWLSVGVHGMYGQWVEKPYSGVHRALRAGSQRALYCARRLWAGDWGGDVRRLKQQEGAYDEVVVSCELQYALPEDRVPHGDQSIDLDLATTLRYFIEVRLVGNGPSRSLL